jgi:hypothetical protein
MRIIFTVAGEKRRLLEETSSGRDVFRKRRLPEERDNFRKDVFRKSCPEETSCEQKTSFFDRFYSRFSDRVEPYSNDRGCHRLLLTGDSPTSPGSEYVNMWNRIDREVC